MEPSVGEKFVRMLTDAQASLYGYVLSLVPDPEQAGEVLQETNLTLWRTADRFQEGTDFLAWACSTAYFQVLTHRKKRQRDRLRFDDEMLKTLADRGRQRSSAIDSSLSWYVNYRPRGLSMAPGEHLFPAATAQATAADVLLTHLMMRLPGGLNGVRWYYDFTHGDQDPIPSDPNAEFRGPTVPETFGDGHTEIRHNTDLQLRATANVVAAFQMWY